MNRWTPEAEEAFREGMKIGANEQDTSWHVVGFIGAALSGFIMGVVVTLVVMTLLR